MLRAYMTQFFMNCINSADFFLPLYETVMATEEVPDYTKAVWERMNGVLVELRRKDTKAYIAGKKLAYSDWTTPRYERDPELKDGWKKKSNLVDIDGIKGIEPIANTRTYLDDDEMHLFEQSCPESLNWPDDVVLHEKKAYLDYCLDPEQCRQKYRILVSIKHNHNGKKATYTTDRIDANQLSRCFGGHAMLQHYLCNLRLVDGSAINGIMGNIGRAKWSIRKAGSRFSQQQFESMVKHRTDTGYKEPEGPEMEDGLRTKATNLAANYGYLNPKLTLKADVAARQAAVKIA